MKTSLILLLVLGLLCLAAAKPHNEGGKRTRLTKRAREHKLTNRMEHGDHHRREHGPAHKPEQHRAEVVHKKEVPTHDAMHHAQPHRTTEGALHKAEARKGAMHRGGNGGTGSVHRGSAGQHDLKKELQLQHITEHNIEKKHEDKDDIPMESERLIHVTARPPKAHRVNKTHHKPSPAAPSSQEEGSTPSTKAKAHRPPKKYSPKKHGWKKSVRKDKVKDKLKEKRDRREKRNKALHRAQIAKKL
ncbi:uncharacterized protein LOC121853578 isoform X2 [Homarus americanus]|uniref:uncharacterized protein LOC121853578 isoform X2 n=1 Tax=Homarus americanus TaxID=6706 RepID=UPI001C44C2B4|nr:uncharacterized protein LOC121853578 isoform X2 [Homarus americanus]